jgi:lysylphosphatidylglycerol synthetase-like protein (DUF2156 family)
MKVATELPPRSIEARRLLVRETSDDPNVLAVLQPRLDYVDTPAGFVAGRRALGRFVALNDPVGPSSDWPAILAAALEAHPRAVFMNLSEAGALALHALGRGYRFCPFGAERFLPLPPVAETFAPPKKVAGALKKARKAGFALQEASLATGPEPLRARVTGLNLAFLAVTPSHKEITFICRPVELLADHPEARLFLLHQGRSPEASRATANDDPASVFGFVVADPWYRAGTIDGYQINAIRFGPTKIWNVYAVVVWELAERFRAEGHRRLSLGGCAFHRCADPSAVPHDLKMLRRLELVKKYGDRFYQLSNFTAQKLDLPGDDVRRFMAIGPGCSVTRSLVRFLRVSEML